MKRKMINEFGPFYEAPLMCGACKCSINGRRGASGGKTWCVLFEKSKNYYDIPPKRCAEMFEKALSIGGDIVIVAKE